MSDSTAPSAPPASHAATTRLALIRAALRLFGQKGFAASSTREIAAAARSNVGSIAYHFGGKEGLRLACAEHVVATINGFAGPALLAPAEALPSGRDAETMLAGAIERAVAIIVARPETGEFVPFLLREVSQPSAALDTVYRGLFEPVHRHLCQLWSRATGDDAESEATRILVFTLIGQILYFRIARTAVLKRMEWNGMGPEETAKLVDVVTGNMHAAVAARRSAKP